MFLRLDRRSLGRAAALLLLLQVAGILYFISTIPHSKLPDLTQPSAPSASLSLKHSVLDRDRRSRDRFTHRGHQGDMASSSLSSTVRTLAGLHMPRMIYGTAWKKDATTDCVVRAVQAGFRAIDTACQPKHYREDLVGAAVAQLVERGEVRREDLFLQTKYTSADGQDPTSIPYNPAASLEDQVAASVARSLQNLRTEYIDSLLLHSPMRTRADTLRVWRALEDYVDKGVIKQLGISNIYDADLLEFVDDSVRVKPSVVQNRFYPETNHDQEVRAYCARKGILYQSFWTLTGNPDAVRHPTNRRIAAAHGATPSRCSSGS